MGVKYARLAPAVSAGAPIGDQKEDRGEDAVSARSASFRLACQAQTVNRGARLRAVHRDALKAQAEGDGDET
jgi:hypothetical protein